MDSELGRVNRRAHPRSRGENIAIPRKCVSRRGSSPLTRGKHRHGIPCVTVWRLIPAHAGKTQPRAHQSNWGRAHPRSRGENLAFVVPIVLVGGSSPLTRGKPMITQLPDSRAGLIPAHAGKTAGNEPARRPWKAHPRSRGENLDGYRETYDEWGSSPLTRGKQRIRPTSLSRAGLIPAHAGKTPDRLGRHQDRRAHPRSRGEN